MWHRPDLDDQFVVLERIGDGAGTPKNPSVSKQCLCVASVGAYSPTTYTGAQSARKNEPLASARARSATGRRMTERMSAKTSRLDHKRHWTYFSTSSTRTLLQSSARLVLCTT